MWHSFFIWMTAMVCSHKYSVTITCQKTTLSNQALVIHILKLCSRKKRSFHSLHDTFPMWLSWLPLCNSFLWFRVQWDKNILWNIRFVCKKVGKSYSTKLKSLDLGIGESVSCKVFFFFKDGKITFLLHAFPTPPLWPLIWMHMYIHANPVILVPCYLG